MKTLRSVLSRILDAMFSTMGMVTRSVTGLVMLLFSIGVIHLDKIDVSSFGIPDEYLVAVVVCSVLVGIITAICLRRRLHDSAADSLIEEGEICNAYELEYDSRYDLGTAVGLILGIAAGILVSPIVSDWLFIGGGMWTAAVVASACTAVMVVSITYILHFGIRKFIVNALAWAQEVADTIVDSVDDAQALKETVDSIVSTASSDDTAQGIGRTVVNAAPAAKQTPAKTSPTVKAAPVKTETKPVEKTVKTVSATKK